MNIFIARQPIFDKDRNVYGYELLHREEGEKVYSAEDGDRASSNVISGGFLSLELNKLTGDKKAFVNFTDNLLFQEIPTILPPDYLVVEVLETVTICDELINACKRIKAAGYTIALDDFVFKPGYEPLVELADIIKVDFLESSDEEKSSIVRRFDKYNIKFLAEKIETHEEYEKAVGMGYTYFQGYFFSKPVTISTNTIPMNKLNQIRLIQAINEQDTDFVKLSSIIEMDASFSYEVLRLVNSAFFSRGMRIKSIKQALIRLGTEELRKWCYLTALRKLGGSQHSEVVNYCMIRARFLELISNRLGLKKKSAEFMTVGILSMLDVLSGCSLEKILQEIPLVDEVKNILLGKEKKGAMAKSFKLVLECEKGHWKEVAQLSKEMHMKAEEVIAFYYEAVQMTIKFNEEMHWKN